MKNKNNRNPLSAPELEETIKGLQPDQLRRFQSLFEKRKTNRWLLPASLTGLLIYTIVVATLVHPGFSWLIIMFLSLFVVFFLRSVYKGVAGEASSIFGGRDQKVRPQHRYYGLIVLPLAMVCLAGVVGILLWAYMENNQNQTKYIERYTECQTKYGSYDAANAAERDDTYSYYYGPSGGSCRTVLREGYDLSKREDYQNDKDLIFQGLIASGFSLVIVYPLGLYYSKILTDKRNNIIAEQIADQVRQSGGPDQ